jgi:hypothetical protein
MNLIKNATLGFAALAFLAPSIQAADFTITIENLTRGTFFTPFAVAAHPEGSSLFTLGSAASAEIQAMAEGGDITGLESLLTSMGATQANNPAGGLLAPGAATTASLNTDGTANTELTVLAMMLPTNDGFVALNSVVIPTAAGTYTYYANAYDAGTEANDEVRGSGAPGQAGFPVPPPLEASVANNGAGIAASVEGYIHIHRGVLGDTDSTGGVSDIDSTMHRWLNPVAKVTITVN